MVRSKQTSASEWVYPGMAPMGGYVVYPQGTLQGTPFISFISRLYTSTYNIILVWFIVTKTILA